MLTLEDFRRLIKIVADSEDFVTNQHGMYAGVRNNNITLFACSDYYAVYAEFDRITNAPYSGEGLMCFLPAKLLSEIYLTTMCDDQQKTLYGGVAPGTLALECGGCKFGFNTIMLYEPSAFSEYLMCAESDRNSLTALHMFEPDAMRKVLPYLRIRNLVCSIFSADADSKFSACICDSKIDLRAYI